MRRYRPLLLSALLLLPGPARATFPAWTGDPGYTARSWTRDQGLPSNSVTTIVQSREGYLWFGTEDGLVRFDGVQIRVFDAGNTPGLRVNRTPYVQEDASGRIIAWSEAPWFALYNEGTFQTFGNELGLPTVAVTSVVSDHEIIVGGLRGAYRFSGKAFEPVHTDLTGGRIDLLRRARDGRLLAAVRGRGLMAFANGAISTLLESPDPIESVEEARDGSLWVAQSNRLVHLNAGTTTVESIPAPSLVREAPAGGIVWAGGPAGLFRRDPVTGRWDTVDGDACTALAFTADGAAWAACGTRILRDGRAVTTVSSTVLAMGEDREGNLWLATDGSGIVRLSRARVGVLAGEHQITSAIGDGRGGFWFAPNNRTVVHSGGDGSRVIPAPTAVRSLHLDPDGTLFIASFDGAWTLDGDRFEPVAGLETFDRCYGVTRSRSGDLWISGFSRIARQAGGAWKIYTEKTDSLSGGPMRFCAEAPDGSLWFASPEGAIRWRDGSFRRFTEEDGLSSKRIRAVHVDERGIAWIGMEGRGVDRVTFDGAGGIAGVTHITERDGLFENGIKWIGDDGRGRLWMTSNRGVFRVSRSELDAFASGERSEIYGTAFDEESGMLSSICGQVGVPAGCFSGSLAGVPTEMGLVLLPLDDPEENPGPVPLLVEDIVIDGEAHRPGGDFRLPLRQRSFEINYTALRYSSAGSVRFRYRLEGLEPGWIDAGRRRTAFFTHVPPGRYVFRVQLANENGVWSREEASVRLFVPPLFNETMWFRGLLGVGVLLLGFFLFRLRLRAGQRRERELEEMVAERTAELERQAEHLEELDQAKSRFFANVSHEFRTPLTLTIGPLEDLISGMHGRFTPEAQRELKTALDSSRSVLDLVNQILDLAKLESGRFRLKARESDLGASLQSVAMEFQPLSERRKIGLAIAVPEDPVMVWFDELLIQRVVRNLLSNAFKFTLEGGTVTLWLETSLDGSAVIRVRDSGAGIPPEEQERIFDRFHQAPGTMKSEPGTGIGLSLARELVDIHRGSISVDSAVGRGTTFTVRLKLGRDHLRPEDIAEGEIPVVSAPFNAATNGVPETASHDVDDGSADRTTILIAEDHPQVRALIRKHLAPRYRLVEAEDGTKALDLARSHVPDLIVSDVMMPGMDGMDLTKAVKNDPDIGFVPVLLLTARADLEDRLTAYSRGADAYLAKPFEPRELVARIDGLIQERRRLKERYAAMAPGLDMAGMTGSDEAYMASVSKVILENLADEDFSVEILARKMGQTRTTLFRRVRDSGKTTPSDLIRRLRLERARLMLERGAGSVNEIAYGVGFKSVSHFCTAFRTAYGKAPGAWKMEGGTKA